MKRRLFVLVVAIGVLVTPACGSSTESGADCDKLFQQLDAFRTAHQEKVISGVAETDAELQGYQKERDRLIAQYEDAGCGKMG